LVNNVCVGQETADYIVCVRETARLSIESDKGSKLSQEAAALGIEGERLAGGARDQPRWRGRRR
jgi:hypothetical protein